ncbi:Dr1-associated corepressor, partial [Phenoliferia sp. Uapishka_3]
ARIKKLIQADEDVGKVAQGTPVVVSKALELFLTSLVAECVKDAEERGSKKITAYGLKRTITATPTFDFCADIVASVPDPITEEVGEDGAPVKKKRVRKPKAPAEDGEEGGEEKPKVKRKRAPPKPKAEGEEGKKTKGKAAKGKKAKKESSGDEDEEMEPEGDGEEEREEDEKMEEEEVKPVTKGKVDDEEDYSEEEDE